MLLSRYIVQSQNICEFGRARSAHALQSFHFQKIVETLKMDIFLEIRKYLPDTCFLNKHTPHTQTHTVTHKHTPSHTESLSVPVDDPIYWQRAIKPQKTGGRDGIQWLCLICSTFIFLGK